MDEWSPEDKRAAVGAARQEFGLVGAVFAAEVMGYGPWDETEGVDKMDGSDEIVVTPTAQERHDELARWGGNRSWPVNDAGGPDVDALVAQVMEKISPVVATRAAARAAAVTAVEMVVPLLVELDRHRASARRHQDELQRFGDDVGTELGAPILESARAELARLRERAATAAAAQDELGRVYDRVGQWVLGVASPPWRRPISDDLRASMEFRVREMCGGTSGRARDLVTELIAILDRGDRE